MATWGFLYDAAGDVTSDGKNQYLYDGEGRICAVASTPVSGMTIMTGYLYDADGTRVAKGTITTWSCDPTTNGFTTTNDYVLGPGGEQMTEMGVGGASNGSTTSGLVWQHSNDRACGKLLATYDNNGLHFYLDDPLGTRRVQTDYAGVLEQACASLPYGDGESCQSTPTEHLFTGKERDAESGNDYFGARYYASNMGRFLTPDWAAKPTTVPYASFGDPQTLNLYSYVENAPMNRVDADGHAGEKEPAGYGSVSQDPLASGDTDAPGTSFTADKVGPDANLPTTDAQIRAAATQAAANTGAAQQQNGTTTTPGDPSRLTQPNPDTVIPGSPSQQRERVYQATDKDGNPITTPGAQIMENAKVTKVTPGYAIDPQTSNGKWINANPGPGQFTDRLGPDSRDKTATYSYTTRQSFQIKIGDTVYPLSTVVRNQITVVGGVVTSIKTTFITP